MKSESKVRQLIVKMLHSVGAFSVENVVGSGCPDVCCTLGWIELKVATSPANPASRLTVDLRPSQVLWHRHWARCGGKAWTLTLVDDQWWLLHTGQWAAEHLGRVSYEEAIDAAVMVWRHTISGEQLIEHLR